jgi:peptidoglycan/LPS O-acetylase OafA/YrhL
MAVLGADSRGAGQGARVDQLDSLRGLAAVNVMASHLLLCVPLIFAGVHDRDGANGFTYAILYTPLHLFIAANEAVILFFILSGFVLSLPFFSPQAPSYREFAIRRVCRIYLPFLASLAIALLIYRAITVVPLPEASAWANDGWARPITKKTITGFLLMTGFSHHVTINPVVWSLVHEMRISLIFPLLLAALSMVNPWWRLLGAFCFSAACAYATTSFPALGEGAPTGIAVSGTLLRTGSYIWFFVVGIELARNRVRIAQFVGQLSTWATTIALMAVVTLYLADWLFAPLHESVLSDFVVGLGAAGFIALALGNFAIKRVLTTAPLLLLGRISYSLYLLHLLVLGLVLYGLHALPLGWRLAIAVPSAIVVAWVSYYLIEKPLIRLGRRLSARPQAVPLTVSAENAPGS